MKDEALDLVKTVRDPAQRLNVLREFLQALVLRSLHESEAFNCLAFVGGTALRFVHGLPRFSEDLDFSLDASAGYDGEKWLLKVKRDLTLAGWEASVTWNGRKTDNTSWIKIGGILKDAGLSGMADQKLSIKLEIDTRPPVGALTENRIVERHRLVAIRCYDIGSLMAGKVHALVTRAYPKGRDWYDFIWYTAVRPPIEPNLVLLQHAFDQTQGPGVMTSGKWRDYVAERIKVLDLQAIRADVLPFLERPREADLITRDNLMSLLENR